MLLTAFGPVGARGELEVRPHAHAPVPRGAVQAERPPEWRTRTVRGHGERCPPSRPIDDETGDPTSIDDRALDHRARAGVLSHLVGVAGGTRSLFGARVPVRRAAGALGVGAVLVAIAGWAAAGSAALAPMDTLRTHVATAPVPESTMVAVATTPPAGPPGAALLAAGDSAIARLDLDAATAAYARRWSPPLRATKPPGSSPGRSPTGRP